jgi:hypothetical protein
LVLASITRGASAQRDTLLLNDRDANAELTRILSAARDAELPIKPILGKVRYGVMAHATPDSIVSKVRSLVARLAVSKDALAPDTTAADIAYGADALEYGATRQELIAVRRASGEKPAPIPFSVLAQLVGSGVPAKRAAASVIDLIKRRASSQQLVALGTEVNADVANGAPANAALDIRLHAITAVLAPPVSATDPGAVALPAALIPKKKP